MPTRLPTPGQDHNQWGDILNNYLLVSHTPTGTLKPHTVGTTQLQDGAITTSHLQPSSVTASTITPGAITEDTLAPSIITKLNTIAGQQGPKGDQGDKGDKGDTGDTGPIGPAGPQGTPGTPGTNGQDGAVGPQGPQGPAGATGAPGQDGATGPAGPQGPKGDKGDQGDAGPVGATGATGPQGPAGQGVPTGGATGQVLAKSSNINYATEWVTPAAAGGSTAWNDITGKPAVIAAGSSAANARTAIGAAPATGISLDATTDAADRLAMTANERTKLANLTGTVYVTTTGATLPGDLADGTLIARYTASGPATPVVTNVGSSILTTGSTTITVTTTAAIPVGDVIAVALNRGTATAGQVMGSAVVSLSGGAVDSWTRASASRAMTHDTALMVARVTSAIASGTTVTITTSTNGTNRAAAIVAGIHNLSSGAPNATSGDDAAGQDRDTNHGPNANGTSISAPTDAVTTVPHTLVLGAFGIGGTSTYTQGAGQTEIGQGKTEVGSADRGVAFGYKVVHSTGIQTMTLNSSISGGMTGVVVALPIELIEV